MLKKYGPYVLVVLALPTLLNFLGFIGASIYLGGDALNGKIVSEHYYVGSHGKYTEVSYGIFVYSTIHALFTIASFLLLVGLIVLLELKGKKDFPHDR